MLSTEPRGCCRISGVSTLQQWDGDVPPALCPKALLPGGVVPAMLCSEPRCPPCPHSLQIWDARGVRRALPAALVPNSIGLLHSGLQEELPDPHSPAACRSPEQLCHLLQRPQTPPAAPKTPRGGAHPTAGPPCAGGTSLPTCRSQHHSGSPGPAAPLTIKAEKTPFFWDTEKLLCSPLTAGKKHLPTDYEKGLEMNKCPWAKHLFLLRIIKSYPGLDALGPSHGGGLGKASGSLICGFGAEWLFWRKELTA